MTTPDAALLSALRRSTIHTPRTELAALLRVDIPALVARIEALREAGFEIDERPGLGYRLRGTPDRLVGDDIHSRTGPSPLTREILVFQETDSTNQRAIQLGESGAAGGVAIFAERQTAGRGRFGRRWESASHLGIWFSLLLRPNLPMTAWPRLTTWASVGLAEAIEEHTGLPVQVKWPNDLEYAGRKLAGILIELLPDRSGGHFAVVGIGLNANHLETDFPPELQERATSLRVATRREIERPAIAAAVLRSLTNRLDDLQDATFPNLIASAARRSSLLGKRVTLQTAAGLLEGLAEGLAPDGRLLLRLENGDLEVVGSGEASVQRGAAV